MSLYMIAFLGLVVSIGIAEERSMDPWIARLSFLGSCGIPLALGFARRRFEVRTRARLRQEKRNALEHEPLFLRANIVIDAVHLFEQHRVRYQAWRSAVADGLATDDPLLEEEYRGFLDRHQGLLILAVRSFEGLQEVDSARRRIGRTSKPGTLSQAAEELGDPDSPALTESRAALLLEHNYADVMDSLSDADLTRRIEEAVRRAPAKALTTP